MITELSLLDPTRVPIALGAIVVSIVAGLVMRSAVPPLWLGLSMLIGGLGERLDRKHRSKPDLLFRGAILLAICIAIAMIILKLAEFIPYSPVLEGALFVLTISSSSIWTMLFGVHKAIENQSAGQGAYLSLARSARLNLTTADDFTITRAAIGASAKLYDRAFVAPILLYILLGLPAVWLFSILSAFAWRFGKSGFHSGFAALAMGLEQMIGYIPSLITAAKIRLAAIITPGLNVLRHADNKASYAQGGHALSAIAATMNISLGGAFQDISGSAIKGAWVGPEQATAQNNHHHIKRTLYALVTVTIIKILLLLMLYLANNGISPSFMLDFFQ